MTDTARTTAIDAEVCERIAAEGGTDADDLVGALAVVDAALTDEHSTYEREYEYATVEGTRVYLADPAEWDDLAARLDLDASLRAAVARAHEAQAEKLLDDATAGRRAEVEEGTAIVVGTDTAEEMA
ncbi:hypothetical protein [Halomarina pelagica]|uniref:hypothetical protein n=1 Tax=Halomarina pelagica TaxID=2961599 RepID=UPI0020C526AE|nr:hypothetical protein [Halomarina sp. BND7]